MTRRTDPRRTRLPAAAPQLPAFTPVARKGQRHDGWTDTRQREFIEALADTGSVHAACKAVDMSQPGAYYLRRQPGAESFRAAWQAALDLGVQRIEDVAMDRALNGVEEPVYSYGELIGTRTKYNDRLLMFMLRNRAPERFATGADGSRGGGDLKGMNAIGKMEKRRLKKKWRAQWQAQWAAEQRGGTGKPMPVVEARQLIDQKLGELRGRVNARRTAEWKALTPETRDAYRHYEELRARDLQCAVHIPDHLPGEADIAEEARLHADDIARSHKDEEDSTTRLPPPGWQRRKDAEEPEEENPKIRRMKDDGWG